jgi:hypothetical protein
MKTARDILILIVLGILIVYGIISLTDYIKKLNFDQQFFVVLGSVSTSIASIGGLLLLLVTFLYLIETRKMAIESRRQRELLEEPAVSVKIVPELKDPNFLFLVIKNTGGGPAYDISVEFIPDLEYKGSTLNELNMFKNMPLLDKGEEVSFFYDSAVDFFKSQKPMQIKANITYYKTPAENNGSKQFSREIKINFEERKGQLHLIRRDIHDLVNEMEELKHALLISTIENRGETD